MVSELKLNICISFVSDKIEKSPTMLEVSETDTAEAIVMKTTGIEMDMRNIVICCGSEKIWEHGGEEITGISKYQEYGLIIYEKSCKKFRIMEALNRAYKTATDHLPQFFVVTPFVCILVNLNGFEFRALVDTGAQLSLISKSCVEKCDLLDYVDSRFQVTASGIGGTSEAIGKLLNVDLIISEAAFPCVLTVMPDEAIEADMIVGIDFLTSYSAQIDLKEKRVAFYDMKTLMKKNAAVLATFEENKAMFRRVSNL